MKKRMILNAIRDMFLVAATLALLTGPAAADYVFDDFNGMGVNMSVWSPYPTGTTLFSQPGDGNLYFNDTQGGGAASLTERNTYMGPTFVSLQYSNIQASNSQALGSMKGSNLLLYQTYNGYSVWIAAFSYNNANGFSAGYTQNGVPNLLQYYLSPNANGWLGIGYNGQAGANGLITFWYDAGNGWQQLGQFAPNYTATPHFGIQGYDTYGNSLSFQVSQISMAPGTTSPVPVPAAVWLLGSGLAGLAGLRRKRRG